MSCCHMTVAAMDGGVNVAVTYAVVNVAVSDVVGANIFL